MVALLAIVIALVCGLACAQPVEMEPLPTALQQPAYTEPDVELEPVSFQEEIEIGCGDECVDCGTLVVQQSFWYGGTDVLATRFNYHASSTASYDSQYTSNDDSAVAVRPYLGWESSTGTGIRTRLWLFEGEVEGVIQPDYPPYYFWFGDYIGPYEIDSKIALSATCLDVDFYRRIFYDRTSLLFGVGTKAASIDSQYSSYITYINEEQRAGGIGVFAEGNHPLYLGPKVECALIGYGRMSLLAGEMEFRNGSDDREKVDLSMSIMEVGLGLEIKRKFRRADFLFQVVSEVQRWETEGNTAVDMSFDALGLRFGGQW